MKKSSEIETNSEYYALSEARYNNSPAECRASRGWLETLREGITLISESYAATLGMLGFINNKLMLIRRSNPNLGV